MMYQSLSEFGKFGIKFLFGPSYFVSCWITDIVVHTFMRFYLAKPSVFFLKIFTHLFCKLDKLIIVQ